MNILKQGINPFTALKLARVQMKIFEFQKAMSTYLVSKESIIENKEAILKELGAIGELKEETNAIKSTNEDVVGETKNLVLYLGQLEERMRVDLDDLSNESKIKDLITVGDICRDTVEGINKILAEKKFPM